MLVPIAFEKSYQVQNRAILVTGCDSGIGLAIAKHLYKVGFVVIASFLHHNSNGYVELNKVSLNRYRMKTVMMDVTKEESIKECQEQVGKFLNLLKIQGLSGLINNVGILILGDIDWTPMSWVRSMVETNVLGNLRVTRAFLDQIIANRGRIIFNTSIVHSIPYPGSSIYTATKAALEGSLSFLREKLSSVGVEVIALRPGDFTKITGIISDFKKNSEYMWAEMSQVKKLRYCEQFRKFYEETEKHFGMISHNSFEESSLFSDLVDSLLSNKPSPHYTPAFLWYKIFVSILQATPEFLRVKFLTLLRNRFLKIGSLPLNRNQFKKAILITNSFNDFGLKLSKLLYSLGFFILATGPINDSSAFEKFQNLSSNLSRMKILQVNKDYIDPKNLVDIANSTMNSWGINGLWGLIITQSTDYMVSRNEVLPLTHLQKAIESNFLTLIGTTKAFLDHLVANNGRIAFIDCEDFPESLATKLISPAIQVFTEGLRVEMTNFNVQCVTLKGKSSCNDFEFLHKICEFVAD